ncbi:MAG: FtsK/SpoIIIE domain-containing protein [Geitlerinemataceae cyanobacterium]
MPQVDPQSLIVGQYRQIRAAALELEGEAVRAEFQRGIRQAIADNKRDYDLDADWQLRQFTRLHEHASGGAAVVSPGAAGQILAQAIAVAELPTPQAIAIAEAPSLYRAKIDPGSTVSARDAWKSSAVYAVACNFAKRLDRVSAKHAPLVSVHDDGDLLIDFVKRQEARSSAPFAQFITPSWIAQNRGRFLFVPGVAPDGALVTIDRREPGYQSTLRGGMSGSGKSMLEYCDIHLQSLLLSPDELHLWLSDPHSGLSPYEGLPHLHGRAIVTDAIGAFNNAVELVAKMEDRKDVLRAEGVDNIDDLSTPFPYCLGKFDEFSGTCDDLDLELEAISDLYPEYFRWQTTKDGEKKLANNNPKPSTVFVKLLSKLAKQGRKYGVHIDIIEQNPKADILPTNVKSELVSMALRLKTNASSRVILDTPGAEKLLGKGDGIVVIDGESVRVQSLLIDPDYDRKLRGECRGNLAGKAWGIAGNREASSDPWGNAGNVTGQAFPATPGDFPLLKDWLKNPQNGGIDKLATWLRQEAGRSGRSEATKELIFVLTGTRSNRHYPEAAAIVRHLFGEGGESSAA